MNVNYLCRFNVSPVDEYSSTREKVQLSTRVQFSLLVSTLVLAGKSELEMYSGEENGGQSAPS